MNLVINDLRKIHEIQEEFMKFFPYLKIDFFSKPVAGRSGISTDPVNKGAQTLGECRSIHNNGHAVIIPKMTVDELVQQFQEKYGLKLLLFRKSGQGWLETSATSGWTLEKQNAEGEALSNLEKK